MQVTVNLKFRNVKYVQYVFSSDCLYDFVPSFPCFFNSPAHKIDHHWLDCAIKLTSKQPTHNTSHMIMLRWPPKLSKDDKGNGLTGKSWQRHCMNSIALWLAWEVPGNEIWACSQRNWKKRKKKNLDLERKVFCLVQNKYSSIPRNRSYAWQQVIHCCLSFSIVSRLWQSCIISVDNSTVEDCWLHHKSVELKVALFLSILILFFFLQYSDQTSEYPSIFIILQTKHHMSQSFCWFWAEMKKYDLKNTIWYFVAQNSLVLCLLWFRSKDRDELRKWNSQPLL